MPKSSKVSSLMAILVCMAVAGRVPLTRFRKDENSAKLTLRNARIYQEEDKDKEPRYGKNRLGVNARVD